MLRVTVRARDAMISSIEARGHSGYSDAGSDIVCAAISALVQALRLGLEDVAHAADLRAYEDPREPFMSVTWRDDSDAVQTLARTIALSIKAIADEYPYHAEVMEVEL